MNNQIFVIRGWEVSTLGQIPKGIPIRNRRVFRVSHILPSHIVKRMAFRFLRLVFGESGRVADWTRSWQGPWLCYLINNKQKVFRSPSRDACLQWEKEEFYG